MSLKVDSVRSENVHGDLLLLQLRNRPPLFSAYTQTKTILLRHLNEYEMVSWQHAVKVMYDSNVGLAVLTALWRLQRQALPDTKIAILLDIAQSIHLVCLNCGSRVAARQLDAVRETMAYGSDGRVQADYLAIAARLSGRFPEAVEALVPHTALLLSRLSPKDVEAWVDDGLRLHEGDRRRRIAYFALEDQLAHIRLTHHEGLAHYSAHDAHLTYLVRSLWNRELKIQFIPRNHKILPRNRARLAGDVVLLPQELPRMAKDKAPAFFEAMILHATAHQLFSRQPFVVGKMKPMQMALMALIEDARVERLAALQYPGLAQVWLQFHTEPASCAHTCGSLFARLARALADPGFVDKDAWVCKGRDMFNAAFLADGVDQQLSNRIARILGHDLGQARIPFDAKSHIVEPVYRDDGLGLFALDDVTSADTETLELLLDATRMEFQEGEDADDAPERLNDLQSARSRVGVDEERSEAVAVYPEWDYRLQTSEHSTSIVREVLLPSLPAANWLTQQLVERTATSARLGGLVKRTRVGRATRLRGKLEGDDLDLEALQDTRIAKATGTIPDPRIYRVRRRLERDVAVALLIDKSKSTEVEILPGGPSILQTAALSAALFGNALAALHDPFGIYAFSSNRREDVQISTIKEFNVSSETMINRLASLRASHSTRLGAALRHVTAKLQQQTTLRKMLIVTTDGEPADLDEPDPLYLEEDARHAVQEARKMGLDLFCIAIGQKAQAAAARIFGKRNTLTLHRIEDLHVHLSALYFRVTVN